MSPCSKAGFCSIKMHGSARETERFDRTDFANVIYTCTAEYLLESSNMLFLQTSRHSPESCPMHNEKAKKAMMTLNAKMSQLAKKHRIKVVGGWVSVPEHLVVMVYEAPNMEAMLKLSMEPEAMAWMGYNTTETRPVMILEETMKLLK